MAVTGGLAARRVIAQPLVVDVKELTRTLGDTGVHRDVSQAQSGVYIA